MADIAIARFYSTYLPDLTKTVTRTRIAGHLAGKYDDEMVQTAKELLETIKPIDDPDVHELAIYLDWMKSYDDVDPPDDEDLGNDTASAILSLVKKRRIHEPKAGND